MSNHTDKQLEELIRQAGSRVQLSSSDKSEIKNNLMSVINMLPERTGTRQASNTFNQRRFAMPLIPLIIATIIALGGGTAAWANTAKPGDTLYPVDQWVERIQERITFTPEAKAGLMANFSEERLAELKAMQALDPSQWSDEMKAKFEQRKQDAVERVAKSIERVNTVQTKFEEKLANADTDVKREVFQKIIEHLDEVMAKREERMNEIENSVLNQIPLRARLQEWRKESVQEMNELRKETLKQLGETDNEVEATEDAKLSVPDDSLGTDEDVQRNLNQVAEIKQQIALVGQAIQDYWEQVRPKDQVEPVEPEPNWPPHLM